ncbi:uncharacterized protein DNG_05726 [Cephalotrichum gorgonifer]|uniref:Uncharacterized protein n=1 Tax=Cephalotrichum gorgonifer TaxID=2041049 RepID=A0AAE8SVQ9_9PEZI|nr:uncharacterized protein DNG_05726 [Cephalotrichum gorgonifer]
MPILRGGRKRGISSSNEGNPSKKSRVSADDDARDESEQPTEQPPAEDSPSGEPTSEEPPAENLGHSPGDFSPPFNTPQAQPTEATPPRKRKKIVLKPRPEGEAQSTESTPLQKRKKIVLKRRPGGDPRPGGDHPPGDDPPPGNFPPEFWNGLSTVWLTARALREFNRRSRQKPQPKNIAPVHTKDLERYARGGGPDLRHIRGRYGDNFAAVTVPYAEQQKLHDPNNVKRISTFDANFDQNLADHDIWPQGWPLSGDEPASRPSNLDDINQRLSNRRTSVSLERCPPSEFNGFVKKHAPGSMYNVVYQVLRDVIGTFATTIGRGMPFDNLESITGKFDGSPMVPAYYEGIPAEEIAEAVIRDLDRVIVPIGGGAGAPVLPSFFFEAAPREGNEMVATRQACYLGAQGARAMHRLQNYGRDEPIYDGKAYTFSATYLGNGTLKLYSHHITAPSTAGGRPKYHMTMLGNYRTIRSRTSFIQGTTVFRNARDLAAEYRAHFVQAANAVANSED